MAKTWKKIIVSGSNAHLNEVSASSLFLYNEDGTGGSFTSASLAAGAGGAGGVASQIPMGDISSPFEGFFDTFLTSTTVANALKEISVAFGDIAPSKPGDLTSQNLTKVTPGNSDTFNAQLAGGLESTHWNTTAHQTNTFHKSSAIKFRSPGTTTRFRAGKYSNFVPNNILEGGVSASRTFRSNPSEIFSTRALTSGVGGASTSTPGVKITSLQQYNTLWVKANAEIFDSLSSDNTGSYLYRMIADNGAGQTNQYTIRYVGGATHYPNQTGTVSSVTVTTENTKYLSGIQYYDQGTVFECTATAQNMFNPVYATGNQGEWAANWPQTDDQSVDNPNHDDTYVKTFTLTVPSNYSNNVNSADTATVSLKKAGKSNVTFEKTLGSRGINSYDTSATNGASIGTFNIENFLDETFRKTNAAGTADWDSTSALANGNLAVVNSRLYHGNKIGSGFTGTNQRYFRIFTPTQTTVSGQIKWSRNGSTFNNVGQGSENGSGGNLEMLIHVQGDTNIYDLGRVVGQNAGDFIGIQDSTVNASTDYQGINFAFPAGVEASSTVPIILEIKYNVTNISHYISQVQLRFN